MGLFSKKPKKDKDLEEIVNQIKVDLSNNYKDNAIEGIQLLEKTLEQKKLAGTVKDAEGYESLLEHFKEDVKNFTRTY